MEAAADRRREVEVLRKQLAQDEAALQEQRGRKFTPVFSSAVPTPNPAPLLHLSFPC
jgi:hypothetical protein